MKDNTKRQLTDKEIRELLDQRSRRVLDETVIIGNASADRDSALSNRITRLNHITTAILHLLASERPDFLERLTGSIEGMPVAARDAAIREIREALD